MTGCDNFSAKWPYSRVIITGGCGFLGSHLAETLLERGFHVCCVDNFSSGSREWASQIVARYPTVRVIDFDITGDWSQCFELINFAKLGLSHLFHLASPASPAKYMELSLETLSANSVGLKNALQFATDYKARLVFSSSSEIYGFAEPPHAEDTLGVASCFGPRACYVEAKRFGEALVYSFNQRYQTAHGVVRIFNTYGPRMSPEDGRVILSLLHRAFQNQTLLVHGDGLQTRSFCYIDDLTDGLMKYGKRDIREPLNLGNDVQITILELAEMIQDMVGEEDLKIEFGPAVQDEPVHRRPDLKRSLEKLAPWRPKVSLSIGLAHTLQWLTNTRRQPLRHEHQTHLQADHHP